MKPDSFCVFKLTERAVKEGTMPPRKRPARGGAAAAETRRYEEELSSLSPEEIRRELQDMGESPGPIDTSNK